MQAGVLPPLLHPAVQQLVHEDGHLLQALVREHGSPLNIVFPHILRANAAALAAVLQAHALPSALFYGAKVNKSPALVRAAADQGIGVDASSLYELRDALRAGTPGRAIVATGPVKPRAFHDALIEAQALISVDSLDELAALQQAAQAHAGPPVRVLLRLRPQEAAASRFGMGADDVRQAFTQLTLARQRMRLEGLHFHLSGYAAEPRARAIAEAIGLVAHARGLGLAPRMIDIGGGLPIRYVDADVYERYLQAQDGSHYRNGRVPESFYPYGGRLDPCAWLRTLLAAPCVDARTVADCVRDADCTLALEPGRSLVDQAAITVFQVHATKPLARRHVVFVQGSSFSACETWFASEFLVDPLLLCAAPPAAQAIDAYIAGHSCLDDDVITNRWIGFPTVPQHGDLLVYANTAGYQMDLLENEFHRHPMPARLAAVPGPDGRLGFEPDKPVE